VGELDDETDRLLFTLRPPILVAARSIGPPPFVFCHAPGFLHPAHGVLGERHPRRWPCRARFVGNEG